MDDMKNSEMIETLRTCSMNQCDQCPVPHGERCEYLCEDATIIPCELLRAAADRIEILESELEAALAAVRRYEKILGGSQK